MQQHTIVVGVDGSPASRAALRWATKVAATTKDFSVAAVAVQRRVPALLPATSMALLPHGRTPVAEPSTRADRLHTIVVQAGDQRMVTEFLLTGDPAEELTHMAGPGDLLVVGRHGALTPMAIGSVTTGCLRRARCPVVVVPPGPEEE